MLHARNSSRAGGHRDRLRPAQRDETAGVNTSGHVLVIGVDGVRFDYLGPDATPAIWRLGQAGLPTLLAVSGWPPLALAVDGGPLFAEASTREFIPVADDDLTWDQADAASLAVWDEADKTITERAGAILAADTTRAPRVSFVYLGAVDFAGHAAGAGDAYRAARR